MCLFSAPKMPDPVDPKVAGGAQTATNIGTAIANNTMGMVNQYGPDGSSLTYEKRGEVEFVDPNTGETYMLPQYDQRTSLSKQGQRIQDTNQRTQGHLAKTGENVSESLKKHMRGTVNDRGLPDWQAGPDAPDLRTGPVKGGHNYQLKSKGQQRTEIDDAGRIQRRYGADDFGDDRQRTEDALMARMEPYHQRDMEALQARLANQGITPGSEAYEREMADLRRSQDDARNQAILSAGQEQSRLVGMERDRAAFGNSAQQQQYGQNQSDAAFYNNAQQAQFGQDMAQRSFNNSANQQNYANNLQRQSQYNNAQMQRYNMGLNAAQQNNALRGQQMQEQFAMRNQPLNEISALLSGSQVAMPQFNGYQPQMMPTFDMAGQMNASQAQAANNAMAKSQFNQSLIGGFMGLGAGGLAGGHF